MKVYKPQLKRTLYLHSNKATKTTNPTTNKNNTFTWSIPPITIDELAEVQIGSISSMGASTTSIYTFRLESPPPYDLCYYSSDNSKPILFSTLLNNLNATFRGDLSIIISAQTINSITIQTSDDMTKPDNGIDTTVNFVLCIIINEFQMTTADIHNPYGDAYGSFVKQPKLTPY